MKAPLTSVACNAVNVRHVQVIRVLPRKWLRQYYNRVYTDSLPLEIRAISSVERGVANREDSPPLDNDIDSLRRLAVGLASLSIALDWWTAQVTQAHHSGRNPVMRRDKTTFDLSSDRCSRR